MGESVLVISWIAGTIALIGAFISEAMKRRRYVRICMAIALSCSAVLLISATVFSYKHGGWDQAAIIPAALVIVYLNGRWMRYQDDRRNQDRCDI